MRRREFITLFGGASVAWPLAARAQQQTMPVIGFLNSAAREAFAPFLAAFRQGLREAGYIEDQNVEIEYRWAEGYYDRLPTLAADLVRRQVAVIVAGGGAVTAQAARAATATIPIVFSMGDDPVKLGFVNNLNLPGGNLTGVSLLTTGLEAKRLEVLHEAVPSAPVIGLLVNATFSDVETQLSDLPAAAGVLGLRTTVVNASSERDSTRPSRPLSNSALARSSSPPPRSLPAGANSLSRWRPATPYPQFLNGQSSLRWAV